MANKEVQRWMLVIRAIVCPMESMDPKYLLLVEQSDRRTWRMATGKDLLLVDRAEPRFFSALRDGYYEPRYCGCEPEDCDCEPEDCDFETDPRPGPPISSEPILRHLAMLATIPAWPNGKTILVAQSVHVLRVPYEGEVPGASPGNARTDNGASSSNN